MKIKPIEELAGSELLREIELMVTIGELKDFAAYCSRHDVKFNDWIRQLACDALEKEKGNLSG